MSEPQVTLTIEGLGAGAVPTLAIRVPLVKRGEFEDAIVTQVESILREVFGKAKP